MVMKTSFFKILFSLFLFLFIVSSGFTIPVHIAVPALGEGMLKLQQWTPIVKIIEDTCGININLIVARDNGVIKRGFQSKNYDMAFVDPFWYVLWKKNELCRTVAQAEIEGNTFRRIMLVVHKDSIFRKLEDLKNKRIAFTLKNESAAGFYLPLAMLLEKNIDPFSYFEENIFSETFQSILKGVAYGKLDAGFITSNIYNRKENKNLTNSLRILLSSLKIPQWILVMRSDFDNKTASKVGTSLINLVQSKEGKEILHKTGFTRFLPVSDKNFYQLGRYIEVLEKNHAAPE